MRSISKHFDGVAVLRDVDFDLAPGEVHVLAGENGAGKSTLMNILAGAVKPDNGTILINGESVNIRSPRDAAAHGVAVIYQELPLVGSMSVAENLLLGREHGFLYPRKEHEKRSVDALRMFDVEVDVRQSVDTLPIATRQLIEIAKVLMADARYVVMDEPTSALNVRDANRLLDVVRTLAQRGTGIVYISHRMDEIFRVADRITVLRDGEKVETFDAKNCAPDALIHAMVGRTISMQYPVRDQHTGACRLHVTALTVNDSGGALRIKDCSFSIHAGEILGVAGLQGSGTSDLLAAVYGSFGKPNTGRVEIDNQPVTISSPGEALKHGMAYVSGDRSSTGIIPTLSVQENITLAALPLVSRGGVVNVRAETNMAETGANEIHVRSHNLQSGIATLSGGNQQKVLLARARATKPNILLLDDPTRGVDVGVKQELYALMNEWTAAGCAILLASSDLQELLAMSDRIVVMQRGKIVTELTRENFSSDAVMRAAMGSAA